jgi:hypothetical protein
MESQARGQHHLRWAVLLYLSLLMTVITTPKVEQQVLFQMLIIV